MINDKSKSRIKRIENFKDLIDEIKPFIKGKKYMRHSTDGKWILTELLNREERRIVK